MKKTKWFSLAALLLALLMLLSACGINISRNTDGSLTVEATMAEADLQREIRAAIADPLIQDMSVDLQDGHIFVSATRKRLKSDVLDTLSFQLDLGVTDGHLSASISQPRLNGTPIDEARVSLWNERIATRLARAGRRNANHSLESVTIGNENVTMVWRVETARSREG